MESDQDETRAERQLGTERNSDPAEEASTTGDAGMKGGKCRETR
jgi:hypothetical protein